MLNVYRASAGSGKTHRLTQDYIHLLFSNKNSDKMYRRILAVTFTNKATEEMKSRILEQLNTLSIGEKSDYRKGLMEKYNLSVEAVNDRARKILISLLHDYSAFSVSTIDRFFQQLIRSFARENGINGGYNLELDNESILQQATDNLFLELSTNRDKQLLVWLTQFSDELMSNSRSWNPRREIIELGHEMFKESFQSKSDEIAEKLQDHDFLSDYKSDLYKIIKSFEQKLTGISEKALKIIEEYGLIHKDFANSETKRFDELIAKKISLGVRFSKMAESVENCYTKTQKADIKARITEAYQNGLSDCFNTAISLTTKEISGYNSAKIILQNINTLGVLSYLDSEIKALTDDQNAMLISDANMLVNKIIDGSDTPFIYEKTGVYTDNFMIDEFQDTSALQWKNFKPLIENSLANNNFNLVVGDVKQSIYRWRNSDWKLLDRSVFNDFRPEQLAEINLDTNWRSDRNIVNFNNAFFKYASQVLQVKLNDQISEEKHTMPEFEPFIDAIVHAYDKHEQKTSPRAGEGFVKVTFVDEGEDDEKWEEESLKRLPKLLEEIQDQGFSPNDVAILVREKKDTKIITQKLLEYKNSEQAMPERYCYNVLGNEGLLISKSGGVNFIVELLHLFVQPNDAISRAEVSFEYLKGKKGMSENEALNLCFTLKSDYKQYCPFFSEEENKELLRITNFSLYELTEQIIRIFEISEWSNEAVFLQAFQDEVFGFSTGRKSDIGSFLKWWDETGSGKFIPIPETKNAFQIMTIHKSKGLDFQVVIMPFCDWQLDMKKGNFKNYLWCIPTKEPYNQLTVLPVDYSTKLENSIFEREYFDEKMHRYIDNLNLAYVAFTRAKHQLICFTKRVKKPENVSKINSLAALLSWSFTDCKLNAEEKPEMLTANYRSEAFIYEVGEMVDVQKISDNLAATTIPKPESLKTFNRKLHLKFSKQRILTGSQPEAANPRKLGIVMHAILGKMTKKSDQEKAVNQCISEGLLSIEERTKVVGELEKFWSLPETTNWFAEDVQVLNEATILTPKGDMHRPDRVVLKNNNAIVIDYKFGEIENKSYHHQVKKYMQLLSEMGYDTKGFIYYVNLGITTEIA